MTTTADDDRLAPVTYLSAWSGASAHAASAAEERDVEADGVSNRSLAHPAGSALRQVPTSSGDAPGQRTTSPSIPDSQGSPTGGPRGSEGSDRSSSRSRRPENVSMHALTRRGMSRWELEKLLEAREVDAEEISVELARLESVGLVDDAALAETVVRTQHERKGLGKSAVRAEMRRRHIDQEQIDAALEGLDDDSELSRARELAQRRAPQLASLDPATAARRLSGYIARKGYSSSVVRTVVDEALRAPSSGVRFDD